MSDEPTKDVEALAEVIRLFSHRAVPDRAIAHGVLRSGWLAERDAQQRQQGAAEVWARLKVALSRRDYDALVGRDATVWGEA